MRNERLLPKIAELSGRAPSRVRAFVEWEQGDTLQLEQQLDDWADDRRKGGIR